MVVAFSCKIVAIDSEKETYKVQSETDVNKYYTVKFMDGTPVYCSCKDFVTQSQKNRNHICKHQRAIVLAENYGLIVSRQNNQHPAKFEEAIPTTTTLPRPKSSYRDDGYSF